MHARFVRMSFTVLLSFDFVIRNNKEQTTTVSAESNSDDNKWMFLLLFCITSFRYIFKILNAVAKLKSYSEHTTH